MKLKAILCMGVMLLMANGAMGALAHYWDCDDAGTGTLADTANNYVEGAGVAAAPMTEYGSVAATPGVAGSGAYIPQYSRAESALYDLGGTFTVEFWLNVTSNGTGGWNIVMNNWGGTLGLHMGNTLYGGSVGDVTQVNVGTYTNPTFGTWFYTAMVADAGAGTVTAYGMRPGIDAGLTLIGSGAYSGTSAGSMPVMLGANAGRAKYGGTNTFDEVAIWDTALSFETLNDHMTNGLNLTEVPEPATMSLLALGGLGVLFRRRR